MSDPTTPEVRTIRVEVAVDTDNLRKWADWHASHRHPDVAHALYRSAERYDDQASALDRVRALAEEGKCWGGADAIEEFIRRLDEILDGTS